jgi:hypothetical protein
MFPFKHGLLSWQRAVSVAVYPRPKIPQRSSAAPVNPNNRISDAFARKAQANDV